MGKSTTADMFREAGISVHDADATVHRLYSGPAVAAIEKAFPGSTDKTGVNRKLLSKFVVGNKEAMSQLEQIVHPLVLQDRDAFLQKAKLSGEKLVVLDIPLLFETGGSKDVDGIIVVTAPADVQRQRVMQREDMNEDKFKAILARQTPDEDKRRMASFVIDTSLGMASAIKAVDEIIDKISSGQWQPPELSC